MGPPSSSLLVFSVLNDDSNLIAGARLQQLPSANKQQRRFASELQFIVVSKRVVSASAAASQCLCKAATQFFAAAAAL